MEVCVDNLESILNAYNGGAKRIELCGLLNLGGLTPTIGFFKVARKSLPPDCEIFVMIRPKPGDDFIYNDHDLQIMMEDIKSFKESGANGFVFGCLDKNKEIDKDSCSKLLKVAEPLPCTFHRAFDVVKNPEESLKLIIDLGFARILTSGQEKNAFLGKLLIKKLVLTAQLLKSDIIIMPGGGIDNTNLREILQTTGVKEFHGSAKKVKKKSDKDETVITDESIVREMVRIGKKLGCDTSNSKESQSGDKRSGSELSSSGKDKSPRRASFND